MFRYVKCGPCLGKLNAGRPLARWTDHLCKKASGDWMQTVDNRALWCALEEIYITMMAVYDVLSQKLIIT